MKAWSTPASCRWNSCCSCPWSAVTLSTSSRARRRRWSRSRWRTSRCSSPHTKKTIARMATMKRILGLILFSALSSAELDDAGGCGGDGGGINHEELLILAPNTQLKNPEQPKSPNQHGSRGAALLYDQPKRWNLLGCNSCACAS
uniref:Uncharacterized protein n=1 Tax=Arundo donax TaxID=35708 RepID=A0A0A9F2F0_ARUDO